jgi:hypothetical protein
VFHRVEVAAFAVCQLRRPMPSYATGFGRAMKVKGKRLKLSKVKG